MSGHSSKYGRIAIIPDDQKFSGGCLATITLFDRARGIMEQNVDELRLTFPGAHCIYKSREDEYDPRGLVVEQDLENGIVSEFLDQDVFIYRKMGGEYITGAFHDILENPEVDVIFDAGDRKVYIGGQKVTSKDFFSQSTLVDVFEYIIKNNSLTTNNRSLPRSSYTKDKNTMNGKILGPLKKVIHDRTGKSMDVKCSGSLIDYNIYLKDSAVTIGILERLV